MENRIKELRAARGMTQAELAEIISVSSRTIISLEKGQYNPSVLLAHKLSLVFECQIEEVFLFGKEDGI
ncbi:transcriptional regulator, XRE family [Methanocorpusculum labreanum Z]|uniref:Transcriptional regulator, XRE family n=1 Tax=Methanocorpusculum labreanum (strain ATCC 43576 / DSM 4855 / Z) TaxID=410358 RepID=A2SPF9_METLZ|nr:helix-turn-helix transcriptional regulator [Methanocorpusculum labreanum]ABN06215.1 transcriptional regulator, XRE family [Methanocorpusculum labreanum Z]